MISPKNKKIIPSTGKILFLILLKLFWFFSKYFERKIIKLTLAISLGCRPNGPILNQLLEPFLSVPMPGIKTNINKIIQIPRILLEFS